MSIIPDGNAFVQERTPIVRLARIQIDPDQLEPYRIALKEEIEASVREEPGVLSLEAIFVKGKPAEVTIVEVYASAKAYESHLESPHFKQYKATTETMVKALELFDCDLLIRASKTATMVQPSIHLCTANLHAAPP